MKIYTLLSLFIVLPGCNHLGPRVTACVINAALQGCDCYDENTSQASFLTLSECDKYVAFPPADAQAIFQYCESK
ncbi:MAG TPA: hypothetical protein VIJ14_10500, partial [Rhabdochlamydiaceae bacterium]